METPIYAPQSNNVKLQDQMASRNKKKSNSSRNSGPKKPSPTAKILEHVELLVALHGEQGERKVSGEPLGAADNSAIVDDIAQKLESQFLKRFDSLEDQIASSSSNRDSDDSSVDNSTLESIIERFDSLESKLTAFENQVQNTDGPQLSASKIQERFDALDDRIEKITAAIEGQQKLIEARNQNVDSSDVEAIQSQFSKMLGQMKNEMESLAAIQNPDQPEGETYWSQQKEEMLSKYGIDPEKRPELDAPTTPDPVLETTMADEELSSSQKISTSLAVTPEESVLTDPIEIERIKDELNAKLRDAEVELSIERAKLSQLQAELESKKIDLDRRDSELTKKHIKRRKNDPGSAEEQIGLLDRLKKHLTEKDRKNLDRI